MAQVIATSRMATSLYMLSLAFNVRRSDEFPRMRGPRVRAPSGRGGCGGRFAASMTLEILHRALVLLGRRTRLERAQITAAASFRVDLARIEAIAARAELADHRYLPRAAGTRRMLRFAARLCALVAIVGLLDGFDAVQPQGTGESSGSSHVRPQW